MYLLHLNKKLIAEGKVFEDCIKRDSNGNVISFVIHNKEYVGNEYLPFVIKQVYDEGTIIPWFPENQNTVCKSMFCAWKTKFVEFSK